MLEWENTLKIIHLALIFFIGHNLAAVDNVDLILGLTSMAKEDQKSFCGKGVIFKSHTIRSYAGEYCKDPLGAAVAQMICEDFPGFKESHCAINARNNKVSTARAATLGLQLALDKGAIKPTQICDLITKILPNKKDDCAKIINPAAPIYFDLPETEKVPTKVITLPVVEDPPSYKDSYPKTEKAKADARARLAK